jgi:hypothetical protein
MKTTKPVGFAVLFLILLTSAALAESPLATPADSPMTEYTAWAVGYSWLTGVLVTVLLGGAFVILNLGLLSKRTEDRVGGRDPSDVNMLRHVTWPQEPYEYPVLPAQENENETLKDAVVQRPQEPRRIRRAS